MRFQSLIGSLKTLDGANPYHLMFVGFNPL